MACEVQKDVKFDEIAEGDLIVLEVFSDDNTRFIGDYRGTARRFEDGVWHFDGMDSLENDEWENYRLFRVEPPTELETLRATVKRAESLLENKRETMKVVGPAIEKARQDKDYMLVAKIEIEKFKLQAEIDLLEYVVNG